MADGTGDYNTLGIPRKPPGRPKSPPSRPAPPIRPPLPKSPKHAPRAGVISVFPQSNVVSNMAAAGPPSIPPIPNSSHRQQNKTPSPTYSKSSDSSSSSPINDTGSLPPIHALNLQDQDPSSAIYEEINDDVVRQLQCTLLL